MDYRSFLKEWLVRNGQLRSENVSCWSEMVRRGRFVDEKGNFMGWHEGYPFYTIGQRRGLGIHLNRPVFVKEILGYNDVIVKIRYRKQENHCTVTVTPDNLLHVQLHEPLTAIAAGQAAAFYRDGLLLGGGIIVNAR